MTTKPGRVVASGKRFRIQMSELLQLFFLFNLRGFFWADWRKFFYIYFIIRHPGTVWSGTDCFHWLYWYLFS